MLIDDTPLNRTVVLVDTNVIIEAVRTGTWNALTGALLVQTVAECREEALRGDARAAGYVEVAEADLARLDAVHPVSETERAAYLLSDPGAVGLDRGEQDLFAHAFARLSGGDRVWILCSGDIAAIAAATRSKIEDNLYALEAICSVIGARPSSRFREPHLSTFLSRYRTQFRLR